jgi:hypothetical protein
VSLTALVRASAAEGISAIVAAQAAAPIATRRHLAAFRFTPMSCRAALVFIETLLGELTHPPTAPRTQPRKNKATGSSEDGRSII